MFVALLLTAALAFRPSTPRRPASRLRAGDAPEGPAWRSELDAIDEAMWRRLRRELYGGPDCGAPSSLRRFEEYSGLRRANVADDFRVVDGGRRAIYLEEQYPNLTARAIWDAGSFAMAQSKASWFISLQFGCATEAGMVLLPASKMASSIMNFQPREEVEIGPYWTSTFSTTWL